MNDFLPHLSPVHRDLETLLANSKSQENLIMNRNTFIALQDSTIIFNLNYEFTSNVLPLAWQHTPRALVFSIESKPAAVMVRQAEKIYRGWRFPSTTVPMGPEVYSNLLGDPIAPLVRMVTESNICCSIELDTIDDKLLIAPYRDDYGLNLDEAVCLQGNYKDCSWLQYQHFIQQHRIVLQDGQQGCKMSFEEYVQYLKTPEDRLTELGGFNMD
jgi:hypothetical protein